MSSGIREMAGYGGRSLVEHLVREENYGRLFELLEEKDFLARQAGILGGFRQGSSDLETHVLKVAIDQGDGSRFLRHAAVAASLRGLAEALADEEILGALVESGQEALAADIVEQLTDPHRRIRARAVVVGARRRRTTTSAVDEGSARLVDELDAVAPPSGEAEARTWLRTLRTVARHLGPELRDHWGRWIARLAEAAPELADDAWSAVVESWIGRDLGPGSGLWPALAKMAPKRVREILPRRLAASPLAGPTFLEEPLPPPFDDRRELLHDVRLALLAAGVVEDPSPFLPNLVIDSVERVELGRDLWPRLREGQREELAPTDPFVSAAFRVVVVEGLRTASETKVDADAEKAALAALDDLPEPVRLHWVLRCLTALAPSQERRRHVRTVARLLYARRYHADAEDLARFLDLVAEELGKDLSRVLPNVVAAPSSQAKTLRALAMRCQRQEVLEELWKNAERYAAVASKNDAEGFQLRSEVLNLLTGRLCALGKDLKTYKETLERLLPEEEDLLRLAVIDELVDGDGEWRRQLALEVCEDLRSRRLALRTRLRLSNAGEVLQPASLYEAVAGSPAVDDELTALAPLLKLPERAEERQGLFLDVADGDRRILALLDLARHDLACQRRAYPSPNLRDPIAALQPLSQAVGSTTSDDRLAALTPELVELGCRVSPSRAVAELQEAVFRLLRLKEVSWPLRSEALGRILLHVEDWVLDPDGLQGRSRRRAIVAFFRWIARLPSLPELAEEELQDVWPRLLPIVSSAFRRLPAERQAAIRRHPLHPFDRWLPRALVKRTTNPWAEGVAGFASWAPDEILTSSFLAGEPPSDVGESSLVDSSLTAVGAGELDPLDARSAPLRRELWELDGENGCAPFAEAVVRALSSAGREGGERALCFWVHSWVRPRLGETAPEGQKRLAALKEALRQAETIPAARPRAASR